MMDPKIMLCFWKASSKNNILHYGFCAFPKLFDHVFSVHSCRAYYQQLTKLSKRSNLQIYLGLSAEEGVRQLPDERSWRFTWICKWPKSITDPFKPRVILSVGGKEGWLSDLRPGDLTAMTLMTWDSIDQWKTGLGEIEEVMTAVGGNGKYF